jgi:hypothetical protein
MRSTGLAVLRITYSDGQRGILVVSCTGAQPGAQAPASMFEGITATKPFIIDTMNALATVDYKNNVAAVPMVDGGRTLFHIE